MTEGHRFSYMGKIPVRKCYPPERIKNQFANDGSFLEMFKKQMEEQTKSKPFPVSADNGLDCCNNNVNNTTITSKLTSTYKDKTPFSSDSVSENSLSIEPAAATRTTTSNAFKSGSGLLSFVGKRRSDSRRSLQTGIVKKLKMDTSDSPNKSLMNASSKYMEEVKRYKTTMCVEDEKSRPLIK